MEIPENRQMVFAALEEEIRKDRSKTKILQISEFGLVEMTRKRVRQSLERSLTQACPYCGGSGRIKSNATVILAIWRQLMKLKDLQQEEELIVRVNPEIYQAIQQEESSIFDEVETLHGIHLVFKPDSSLHHEQFDLMTL
jgi:ribonuclease G